MDFDDRLRQQMHSQSGELVITPEGSDAVAVRARARKQRRTAGIVVAAALMVAGVGGWLVGRNSIDQVEVAAPDATEQVELDGDDVTAASAGDAQQSSVQGSSAADSQVVAPGLGPSLVFTDVSSDSSPGGYNIYQNGRVGEIYYVLSTAPGVRYEDLEGDEFGFRADTLYTFDGSGWESSKFGDRFVSTINSSEDGVLYTVSTGTSTSQELAVGSSTDAGRTWTWTTVDLSAQLGPDSNAWPYYRVLSDSEDAEHFIVVEVPAGPDWQEAINLARNAGVDIDQETDEIYNIDEEGIDWLPDAFEYHEAFVGPCSRAIDEFYSANVPEEPLAEEPPFQFDEYDSLTDEQKEEIEAFYAEQDAVWSQIQIEANDFLRTVDGCQSYADCQDLISAKQSELEALARQADDGEQAELVWADYDKWFESTGCEDVLSEGIDYDAVEQQRFDNAQSVTWDELGVTIPDHWRGSRHGYLVTGGEVTQLGPLFPDQSGFMLEVSVDDAGYGAVFDSSTYEPFPESEADYRPSFEIYESSDALTWTATTSDDYRYSPEIADFGGATFDIAWSERGDRPSDLRRRNPDGSSDLLRLKDLAPDLDPNRNYSLWGVTAGDYGIVAWGGSWDDNNDIGYDVNAIVLFSADGINWGATPIDGLSINDVEVGVDDVLIFTSDPRLANSGEPQPLLLGTV